MFCNVHVIIPLHFLFLFRRTYTGTLEKTRLIPTRFGAVVMTLINLHHVSNRKYTSLSVCLSVCLSVNFKISCLKLIYLCLSLFNRVSFKLFKQFSPDFRFIPFALLEVKRDSKLNRNFNMATNNIPRQRIWSMGPSRLSNTTIYQKFGLPIICTDTFKIYSQKP